MNEDPQGPKEIPVFCWIVGCAIPINASSVCKYLFDKVTDTYFASLHKIVIEQSKATTQIKPY